MPNTYIFKGPPIWRSPQRDKSVGLGTAFMKEATPVLKGRGFKVDLSTRMEHRISSAHKYNIVSVQAAVKEVFSTAAALSNSLPVFESRNLRRLLGGVNLSKEHGPRCTRKIITCSCTAKVRDPDCFTCLFASLFANVRYCTIQLRTLFSLILCKGSRAWMKARERYR